MIILHFFEITNFNFCCIVILKCFQVFIISITDTCCSFTVHKKTHIAKKEGVFLDHKFNVTQNMKSDFHSIENIVVKEKMLVTSIFSFLFQGSKFPHIYSQNASQNWKMQVEILSTC